MLTRRDLLQKLRAAVSFGENLASLIVDSGQAPADVLVTCSLSEECLLHISAMEEGAPLGLPTGRNPQGLALSTLAPT